VILLVVAPCYDVCRFLFLFPAHVDPAGWRLSMMMTRDSMVMICHYCVHSVPVTSRPNDEMTFGYSILCFISDFSLLCVWVRATCLSITYMMLLYGLSLFIFFTCSDHEKHFERSTFQYKVPTVVLFNVNEKTLCVRWKSVTDNRKLKKIFFNRLEHGYQRTEWRSDSAGGVRLKKQYGTRRSGKLLTCRSHQKAIMSAHCVVPDRRIEYRRYIRYIIILWLRRD